VAQMHTLDALFNRLTRQALGCEAVDPFNALMRMALKAQAQCARTAEIISNMKNPRPVAFVAQANVGQNVQVNNGNAVNTGVGGTVARAAIENRRPNYWMERVAVMKWLLVVIVMNTPVKTDLVFDTLIDCLKAESEMRQQWANVYNATLKRGADKDSLAFVNRQMTSGTCIPSK